MYRVTRKSQQQQARQRAAQRQADEPLIACIRSTLASGGMGFDALKKAVMAESGQGRNTVSEVIDRYCGTDASDTHALWLETRMRLNNTRHISLKPGRQRESASPG